MTPEQTELAKRLAAHPKFEWREGMLVEGRGYVVRTSPDHEDETPTCVWVPQWPTSYEDVAGLVPGLGDFATVGVLLGMLVEASGGEPLAFEQRKGGWSGTEAGPTEWRCLPWVHRRSTGPGGVLAEALLAAWGEP